MPSSTNPRASALPAIDGRLAEGIELARVGRYEEAECLFRDALAAAKGTGSETEMRACLNLGTLYGILGRCLEALLLYRHGLALTRAQDRALPSIIYLANIGGIYVQLGLRGRLPRVLERIERLIETLEGEDREAAERYAAWQRYEVAAWEGDVLGARRALDRIRETFGADEDPRVRAAVREIESHELSQRGHVEEAVERLEGALAQSDLTTTSRLDLLSQKALLLERAGLVAEAAESAAAALDLLDTDGGTDALSEESIGVGKVLAAFFARAARHDQARRAYDVTAAAMLRRMHQLDACVQDLPDLGILDAADRAWIGDLRREFEDEQDELRERVLHILEAARRRGISPVHSSDATDDLVRICAWCGMVRSHKGRWVPIRQYLPPDEQLQVTHTICPACDRSMASESSG